jgi:hypothetical protein
VRKSNSSNWFAVRGGNTHTVEKPWADDRWVIGPSLLVATVIATALIQGNNRVGGCSKTLRNVYPRNLNGLLIH